MQRCPSPARQGKDPLRRRTPNPLLPPRGSRCLARVQWAEADEGASRPRATADCYPTSVKRLDPHRRDPPRPGEIAANATSKSNARALRQVASPPEARLWSRLRTLRATGLIFRRQHPLGPYIADFFCPVAELAIEVDGAQHNGQDSRRHDRQRDEWMTSRGVMVLRFSGTEVLTDIDAVVATITLAASRRRDQLGREPTK
jgi:very-short-patch-repair endonuclease